MTLILKNLIPDLALKSKGCSGDVIVINMGEIDEIVTDFDLNLRRTSWFGPTIILHLLQLKRKPPDFSIAQTPLEEQVL